MGKSELEISYDLCRQINKRHGKTYYFSALFFPPEIRRSVHALYGFVRYPDEMVDNPAPGASPAALLADYRVKTLAALKTGLSDIPVLTAFADTAHRHGISPEYPLAFLDAMAMDLTRRRYAAFEDLQSYTYGSASVVGLMMCRLMGVSADDALLHAAHLGLAMQLTNFWRDIGEDWTERGRIYLPQEDMARFGYREEMLANGIVNDSFRELMRFEIARTREYYISADQGIASIPAPSRLPVQIARALYAKILDKIEENDYDVFHHRARTSNWEKVAEVVRQQFPRGYRQASPTDQFRRGEV